MKSGQDARVDGQSGKQLRPDRLVVEQLIEKAAPRVVRADRAGHRLGHREAGWQAGLDRRFAEDAGGEAMQGHDHGVLERAEGNETPITLPLVISRLEVLAPAGLLQTLPDAAAQLGRGVLGEGDRGQVADLGEMARRHHVHDARDQ